MVIVQINATYGYGSTGHIVADIHKMLRVAGHESHVFCGISRIHEPEIQIIGNAIDHKLHAALYRIFHNQGWNSLQATKKLCGKLQLIKPDLVHLHNLHSNYINLPYLLHFLAQKQIATVITLHDCWFFTGHCYHFIPYDNCQRWQSGCKDCPIFKNKLMKEKVSDKFKEKQQLFSRLSSLGVIGVSDWTVNCARQSFPGMKEKIKRIYNWIDCDLFSPKKNREKILKKYNILLGQKMILGVSQGWSPRKGLAEFLALNQKLGDSVKIILVGNVNGQSSQKNLKFIGFTADPAELAELYSAADLFVNPSRMETFGKVTAEALACGTPVAAYDNTGTAELITPKVGTLAEDGNINHLVTAVQTMLAYPKSKYSNACRSWALKNFEKKALLTETLQFYQTIAG